MTSPVAKGKKEGGAHGGGPFFSAKHPRTNHLVSVKLKQTPWTVQITEQSAQKTQMTVREWGNTDEGAQKCGEFLAGLAKQYVNDDIDIDKLIQLRDDKRTELRALNKLNKLKKSGKDSVGLGGCVWAGGWWG